MMINSRITNTFHPRPLGVTLATSAMLLLAVAALSRAARADDQRAPDLVGDCQRLRVGPGNKVAFHAFGVGGQNYRWSGTSWIFVAPDAVLYANAGDDGVVGIHFGGPTWQSNSGSKVVGTVIDHCTPDPSAIPWVLLAAVPRRDPGFSTG